MNNNKIIEYCDYNELTYFTLLEMLYKGIYDNKPVYIERTGIFIGENK